MDNGKTNQYLVSVIDDMECAFSIRDVLEIKSLDSIDLQKIKSEHKHIVGCAKYSSDIIPIIDARPHQDKQKDYQSTAIVILFNLQQNNKIGLMVDSVIDIVEFNPEQLKSSETINSTMPMMSIDAVTVLDDKIVTIIDINKLYRVLFYGMDAKKIISTE